MTNINLSEFLSQFRWQVAFLLIGTALTASGLILFRSSFFHSPQIEIIQETENELVVEVGGSVSNPGVYHLPLNSRVDDALNHAGGMTEDADLLWVEKTLNRAGKLQDGQKIYIPTLSEQSDIQSAKNSGGTSPSSQTIGVTDSKLVNINTATQNELESLWGIGPVTAQNIIEQRPYSSVEELLVKKILKSNVYERNKELLTIY